MSDDLGQGGQGAGGGMGERGTGNGKRGGMGECGLLGNEKARRREPTGVMGNGEP